MRPCAEVATARILVVEAAQDVRTLIADLLAEAGHEVHCANHGADVLARPDGSTFGLILSDLTMPGIEGIALYCAGQGHTHHASARIERVVRGHCRRAAPAGVIKAAPPMMLYRG